MAKDIESRVRPFSPRLDAHFRLFAEGMSAVVWSVDTELRITSAQGSGLAVLNLKPDQLKGVSLLDHFQRQDPDLRFIDAHRRALRGESLAFEVAWQNRPFEVRLEPLRNGDGTVSGALGVALERDAQKRPEVPHDTDQLFRALIENSSDMMALVTDDGSILYASPSTTRILGYPLEEFVGRNMFELIHPEDRERMRNLLNELLAKPGGVVTAEYRLRAKDGSWRWIEGLRKNLLHDPNTRAIVANYRDITQRKRTEAERQVIYEIIRGVNVTANLDELLQLIHLALKKVLYAENCFIALHDKSTGLFRFPFFVDQFDAAPAPQKVGKSCTAYVFRTGRPMLIPQKLFDQLAEQGQVELVGSPSPTWLGVPLKTPSETIGVLVVQHYEDEHAYTDRDVEFLDSVGGQIALAIERKQAEEAVRDSEERYRSLVENAIVCIHEIDLSGRIMSMNPAGLRMMGATDQSKICGFAYLDFVAPGDRARVADLLAQAQQGQPAEFEFVAMTEAGPRVFASNFIPIKAFDGSVIKLMGVTQDVTENKRLEQQLRQAVKMEAVGRLAGGMAHDFNNLLMVIKGHTELLLERVRADEWQYRKINQIQKSAERAAGLTRQLLAFSRMQVLQPKVIDLNTVVVEMGKLLPRLIGEDIELAIVTDPRLGRVKADPGQIEQVIMNLAVNARDAMPEGGKLVIETANVELDEAYARRHPPLSAGRYVLLAVTDNGIGMDAETQVHIFEPFFTTKEKGKGTGLGLATVYGVVKQSGGYVWLYSEVGQGTTFKIYLPRVEEPAETVQSVRGPAETPQGFETILLAEDEREVRDVAREFLELTGYTVLEAKDGAEAIEMANRHPGPIHLLVTDMVMPGMGGRELAARLAGARPEIKVIYMSGYTEYATVRQGELEQNAVLLTKPFTRGILARTVREVLHGGKVQ